ncbi:MAG: STAS domain-containing protein [Bacteroidales bacterium]
MHLNITADGNHYKVGFLPDETKNEAFSGPVREQLLELVGDRDARVILDLDALTYIDTAGFGVLREISARARHAGSQFKLCNIRDEVREMILLMELEGEFTFCHCEREEERVLLVLG